MERAVAYYIKTGQLARKVGVLPSKIRYYVREGLLRPTGQTPGGFFLFDEEEAMSLLSEIEQLQSQERLTISEIKQRLNTVR
ncbi:MAG: MerR family transcriptional regulator [Dehalococcoidia bacterium]